MQLLGRLVVEAVRQRHLVLQPLLLRSEALPRERLILVHVLRVTLLRRIILSLRLVEEPLRELQVVPRLVRAVLRDVVLQVAHHRVGQRRRDERVLHRHRQRDDHRLLVHAGRDTLLEASDRLVLLTCQAEGVRHARSAAFVVLRAEQPREPSQRLERRCGDGAPPG